MNKDIKYSLQNNWCIRIRTRHPEGDAYDGIVLDYNRHYVVFREIYDFEPDGIHVIPKRWIKSIRNGKLEKSYNDVIRVCNTLDNFAETGWVHGMNSLEDIMGSLKSEGIWPAIELIRDSGSSLYIGEIIEVSKSSFSINCYDATGEWEKIYNLKYDMVFRIEIDSKYTMHFNNYMRTTKM